VTDRRGTYLERLAARSEQVGSVLCLGIDPDPETLPPGFGRDLAGIERFSLLLLEGAARYAAAVKPNLAFFEAYGAAGVAALERVLAAIPTGLPVVLDAKRGDIGSTAARHAVALFDHLGADAVTLSPYLGPGAIEPLLERVDRFCYVLCRTSNPGAGDVQDLVVAAEPGGGSRPAAPAEPLHARIARMAAGWGPGGTVGLVVGATAPDELRAIRGIAPGLAFLVPGVGVQGGAAGPVLKDGRAVAHPAGSRPGGGLLVNVSRGISGAAVGDSGAAAGDSGAAVGDSGAPATDPLERVDAAARAWSAALPVLT